MAVASVAARPSIDARALGSVARNAGGRLATARRHVIVPTKARVDRIFAGDAGAMKVAVTGAGGGCEPSSDESGTARAADIGKKRSQRAAAAGASHSHSHAHGGQTHSHSHGGHSHAPGVSIGHAHIGHTHGAKSGGKGGGSGGKGGGKKGIEHRSSSWAKGGGSGRKAARGLSVKELERRQVKAGRKEARELAAWSSGMNVRDVGGGSEDGSGEWE